MSNIRVLHDREERLACAGQNAGGPVRLRLAVLNVYDGATRLLGDLERMGLILRSMQLLAPGDGCAEIDITLDASMRADRASLVARLARHPTVASIALLDR